MPDVPAARVVTFVAARGRRHRTAHRDHRDRLVADLSPSDPRPCCAFSKCVALTQVSAWHRRERGCRVVGRAAAVGCAIRDCSTRSRARSSDASDTAYRALAQRSRRGAESTRSDRRAPLLEEYRTARTRRCCTARCGATDGCDPGTASVDAEAVQPPRPDRGVGRGAGPAQRRSPTSGPVARLRRTPRRLRGRPRDARLARGDRAAVGCWTNDRSRSRAIWSRRPACSRSPAAAASPIWGATTSNDGHQQVGELSLASAVRVGVPPKR